jgi:hypothetical protein
MARIMDLLPGDKVTLPAPEGLRSAVFVAQTQHPLWQRLRLVVWRLDSGEWSHDALDAAQVVGEVHPSTRAERIDRLRAALLGPGAIR